MKLEWSKTDDPKHGLQSYTAPTPWGVYVVAQQNVKNMWHLEWTNSNLLPEEHWSKKFGKPEKAMAACQEYLNGLLALRLAS